MWKLIILLIAGFVLYKMFMGDKKKKDLDKKKETEKKAATGQMVKDPICGAFVPLDGDIRVREGENVHHFCSYDCRDKFIKRLEALHAEPNQDEKQQ
ncbi:TRASH domain-containing protein [Alkalidesulfovibrio alkalitolerans DSM 16529]|jgi:YHS domain-containing protein|uniref:TRASH domain-containing protein n=1 Tax=Alkalidesulfovibrio alkalitolerans DSM 16529 TaxID=1121439 RepID=S7T1I6_9BACT|nr:TRASH domain-containing protein [Alkalidesulfovibrio alkalitolerans DSM 16529]